MTTFSSQIRNGTGSFHLELRQESQSVSSNSSVVSYKLYIKGKDGYGFWNMFNSGKTDIYIDGSRVHYQTGRNFDLRGGGTQQLASGTTTVKHNDDGSKSFNFSASLWSSSATGSLDRSFSLAKIPRASDFYTTTGGGSRTWDFTAGDVVSFRIDRKAASFSHTLKYVVGDISTNLFTKSSFSSYDWKNSMDFFTTNMKSSKSMDVYFYLDTYDGNTLIGQAKHYITIKAPDFAKPSIDSLTFEEANRTKAGIIGSSPFYQILTDLRVLTKARGKYGASINTVSVKFLGQYRYGESVVFEEANVEGTSRVEVSVTDSRGFSSSLSKEVVFKAYKLPNISFFNAYRDLSNSKVGKARLSLESTVIGYKNPLNVVVELAEKGSSFWRTVYSATVGNGKFNGEVNLGTKLDDFKAYDVRARVNDKFKSHVAIAVVPATNQSLVIGANKPIVGIGRVPDIDKGLEVDGLIQVDGDGQKKIRLRGSKSSGAMVEWDIDGNTDWLASWGGGLNFGGNVHFRDSIYIKNGIKPYDRISPYNISLQGLSGSLKATKDPLGNVHVWGKVTIKSSEACRRWQVWGRLPSSWGPRIMTPLNATTGSFALNGVVVDSKGQIFWVAEKNGTYTPSVGDGVEFDTIYRAGDSDW